MCLAGGNQRNVRSACHTPLEKIYFVLFQKIQLPPSVTWTVGLANVSRPVETLLVAVASSLHIFSSPLTDLCCKMKSCSPSCIGNAGYGFCFPLASNLPACFKNLLYLCICFSLIQFVTSLFELNTARRVVHFLETPVPKPWRETELI